MRQVTAPGARFFCRSDFVQAFTQSVIEQAFELKASGISQRRNRSEGVKKLAVDKTSYIAIIIRYGLQVKTSSHPPRRPKPPILYDLSGAAGRGLRAGKR